MIGLEDGEQVAELPVSVLRDGLFEARQRLAAEREHAAHFEFLRAFEVPEPDLGDRIVARQLEETLRIAGESRLGVPAAEFEICPGRQLARDMAREGGRRRGAVPTKRKLVAEGMMERNTLEDAVQELLPRRRVLAAHRDGKGEKRVEVHVVRLERLARGGGRRLGVALPQIAARDEREGGCPVLRLLRSDAEAFASRDLITFDEVRKAVYVVRERIVGVDRERLLAELVDAPRFAAAHLARGEFGVGRDEEAVLRDGLFEVRAPERVIALRDRLRAAHVFAVGARPVEVDGRVDRTRPGHLRFHVFCHGVQAADRAPVLDERLRGAGCEGLVLERRLVGVVTRLVEAAAGLQFGVLPVGVRLVLHPEKAVWRQCLEPDLATELLVCLVAVVAAEAERAPPDAVEAVVAGENMVRLRSAPFVAGHVVDAPPVLVHDRPVPRLDLALVSDDVLAGEEELRVVLDGIRSVHPVVVGRGEGGRVVPGHVGLKFLGILRQAHLHLPERARNVVLRRHEAACGTVWILAGEPVDGRAGAGVVSDDAEVELDAAGCPGTAQGDVAELHHVIREKEVAPRLLVRSRPDLAADLRQQDHADRVVLKRHGLPCRGRALVVRAVVAEVGIACLRRGRNWVGVRERIRLHLHLAHRDRRGQTFAGRQNGQQDACYAFHGAIIAVQPFVRQ